MTDTKAIQTMRALYNLSIDPAAPKGERDTASKMLNDRLKKHKLTLADIAQTEKTTRVFFAYKTAHEESMLYQLISTVKGIPVKHLEYWGRGRKKELGADLTKAEAVDVGLMFKHYRAEMKKSMDDLYIAFMSRHNLYGPSAPDQEYTKHTEEELARLRAMMSGISATTDPRGRLLKGGK